MALDYQQIGRRIAARRRALGLKQVRVCERCDINSNYLSNIDRAKSIPSLEVFVRICQALDTTPDELLAGAAPRENGEGWKNVAEKLRGLDSKQLELADHFITWVSDQKL